ncbi:hypothetical protein ACJRO7_031304 [Eucalyptus globulus]|uniref:F-box domain-containing protein n=1 Tax=Eucalyptus globulus TaxID=34317 RepID=A0ABD3JSA0_EUCGL
MEKRMAQESDRISLLPGHIVDEILRRLPIKEAGRTSVLSRTWRYKWRYLPHLWFDNQCTWSNGHGQTSQNLVKIIDRVLMLHSGPIQSFILAHTEFSNIRDIDHWMLHLSKVPVKQILLLVCTLEKYKIPTFFFNCQHLNRLRLYGCSIKIPISFEGFKNLDSLYLQRVELSPYELEALISRCPLLTHLVLKYLPGITRLNLEAARNLMELDVRGAFQDVFGVTNRLRSVTIDIIENRQASGNANSGNFHKFFRNVHNIQILKIENYSLKYLAQRIPWTLPHPLVHLKHLSACVDFTSVKQIATVICLIKSSPQLKKIEFQAQDPKNQPTARTTEAEFWKLPCHSCCLEQVQVVSMRNIFGIEPELEFMKFLLTSSPNLQKMVIQPSAGIAEGKLLRELLQSRRVSAQAQVTIL